MKGIIPAEGYFRMSPAADKADDLLLTLSFTYTFFSDSVSTLAGCTQDVFCQNTL